MNQSYEPHRLVIQHLSILESAPLVVEEVEKTVFDVIDKKIEKWVKARSDDWEGFFDYLAEETSFKPESWDKDEHGTFRACYALGLESPQDGDHYMLSSLLGIVPQRYGLFFQVDTSWITGRVRPGAVWKKYLAEQFPHMKLAELGFEFHGEVIFLPIRVDADILSEDYPDSIDDALVPLGEALKKLESAHPELNALIKAAQQHFNSVQSI